MKAKKAHFSAMWKRKRSHLEEAVVSAAVGVFVGGPGVVGRLVLDQADPLTDGGTGEAADVDQLAGQLASFVNLGFRGRHQLVINMTLQ